jgi:hypothetical protein
VRDLVPVGPLREAVEDLVAREGEDWARICRRLGWMIKPSRTEPRFRPDVTRLRRRLGMVPVTNGHGYPAKRSTHMRYEVAVEIVRGLGWYPVDFDL